MSGTESRPILVTGAGSGIGRAIALSLAEGGHPVAVTDRDGHSATETTAAILDSGGVAAASEMDVTDDASIADAVSRLRKELGAIGGLVNNAGFSSQAKLLDHSSAMIDLTLAVNVVGPIKVTSAVLPQLRDYGSGRVVNIASDSARAGLSNAAVYTASKGAVLALTRSLAREFAADRITVNAVSPGVIDTPMFQASMAGTNAADQLLRSIPLRRLGQPEDVAAAVVFFCSDASEYITGQILSVNGGMIIS